MNMFNIDGDIIKDDETYLLKDNKSLKNLVVSSTTLHAKKSTRGHRHIGQEEVYFFISGKGIIELDDRSFYVSPGQIVQIEDGIFHRVHNTEENADLYFVCVFDGKRNH